MPDSPNDQQHFIRAVTQLGERHAVVATQAILNAQGAKVVEKGAPITPALLERLQQTALSAPIEHSVACASTVTGPVLKQCAEELMRDVPLFSRMAPDENTRKALVNILEGVPLPDGMAFQLTVAREVRPELFLQLVRTALTAVWLARMPMVSRFDLGMAAAGGLMHDIGMLHVDPLLLQPEQVLNPEQRRQLYSHPMVSSTLMARHHQYSKEVVRAVGEHQEYLDGSGYPRSLVGDAISPLGKILSLAQVVAAMFAAGRNAPEMRLSVLLRMTTDLYDEGLALRVMALLKPQIDVMSVETARLDDPIHLLQEINRLLSQLPLEPGQEGARDATRRDGMALVGSHAGRIQRGLARAGAVPDQLAQLGDGLDEALLTELTLLTHEATWQLRTLSRHARRRWATQLGEPLPPRLGEWLDQVDALVAQVASGGVLAST